MSNCTSKEDSDDSSKDSKKAKKPSMYLLLFRIIRFNNIHLKYYILAILDFLVQMYMKLFLNSSNFF